MLYNGGYIFKLVLTINSFETNSILFRPKCNLKNFTS